MSDDEDIVREALDFTAVERHHPDAAAALDRIVARAERAEAALREHHNVGNQLTTDDWGKPCRICAALATQDVPEGADRA
jgi:hypothetical protein